MIKNATRGPRRFERQKNNMVVPVALLVLLFLVGQGVWLHKNQHKFRPFSIQRINCDVCQRLGLIPSTEQPEKLIMCPKCFGVGFNSVRRVDDQDMICLACDGQGRLLDRDGHYRTCRRCDGRGLHQADSRFDSSDDLVEDAPPRSSRF